MASSQSVRGTVDRMYWDLTVTPPKLRPGDPPPTQVGTGVGAPTTGSHAAGELWLDSTGELFACSVSGTPGTWAGVASGAVTSPLTITSTAVGQVPLSVVGAAGQTGDLLDI